MARLLIRSTGFPKLKDIGAPMRGPLGAKVGGALRRSVEREFAGEYWASPGGDIPWVKAKPFGTRQAGPTLTRTGRLRNSYGALNVTDRTVSISSSHPLAEFFRGGTGNRISTAPRIVKAKKLLPNGRPAMQVYLGVNFGVWISTKKLLEDGILIAVRPHATSNPRLVTEIRGHVTRDLKARMSGAAQPG